MKKTFLFLILIPLSATLYAAGFGIGGIGFGDDEGSSVDLGAVVDVFSQTKQVLSDIDPEAERKLGQDAAAIIVAATPVINNKRLNDYINKVGRWVAQHSERPDLEWRFAVLDTIAINAYATPGGYVFITAGLLLRLRSEAELATVLGHEIVHVVQAHHVRAMKKIAAVGLAGTIAGAATGNEILAEISMDGIKDLYSRGLGRDDELEADRMGVVLAARAGYDPYAFLSVLLLLDSMNKENGALAQFLATHPSPAERFQNLELLMKNRLDKYDDFVQGDKRFVESITEAFEGQS